ncbi:hypothetical protein ACLK17_25685 [Escherichia coli]
MTYLNQHVPDWRDLSNPSKRCVRPG